MTRAAIGFRAKTGRAIAVALITTDKTPRFAWRREISLVDPDMPATGQPYHEVMELPWDEALVAVQPFVARIEAVARAAVVSLIRDLSDDVQDIGIVGSPDRPLARIGNFHIRAHAAEGTLFRRVLETAAQASKVDALVFSDREIAKLATAKMTAALKAMGKEAGPPWRADERAAATAAWLALER